MYRILMNVDELLDKAMNFWQLEPDWSTIMQICDLIRQSDVQPKAALTAIKKKMISTYPHVALHALLLLESCVKNCGTLIHDEIATKQYMEQLKEFVKTSPHENVRLKTLELIQAWAHAFRHSPKYRTVQDTLNIMKAEGYQFPVLKESDAMFRADTALASVLADGGVCSRSTLSMVPRKHYYTRGVVLHQFSSKVSTLPKFGIEKEVRVCEQVNKPSTTQTKDTELPAEYLKSTLAQQQQCYDALEELLQCPVCLEASQGVKVQCTNGHHICNRCRTQVQICPICKSNFMATRNLAVEQISAKLHDIKLSLLHPYHALNRRILHNKICVATQTENIYMPSTACQTESMNQAKSITLRNEQQKQMINLAPRVGKGSFPCRIGSCKMELPYGRMIGHLRYYHKDTFYEFTINDNIFRKKWSYLEYILDRDYDFAFFIKEMGLFFLNISIDQRGDLMAFVQLVNCTVVSKQFTYTFEAVGPRSAFYNGLVKSCRVRRDSRSNECLHVRENSMRHMVNNKNYFHCNLTIKRRIEYKFAAQNNPMHVPDDIVND